MNKEELHQMLHPMKLIGLGGNQVLAERIAGALDTPLLETTVHHFSDGEIQVNRDHGAFNLRNTATVPIKSLLILIES